MKRLAVAAALLLISAMIAGCAPAAAPVAPATIAVTPAPSPVPTPDTPAPTLEPMKALSMKTLIPLPVAVGETGGTFTLVADAVIRVEPMSDEMMQVGQYTAQALRSATGLDLPVAPLTGPPAPGDILLTTSGADPALGQEGYDLLVTPDVITVAAPQPEGVFRAVQTLRQLLPAAGEAGTSQPIATGVIRDQPRFAWRGMMLDVARHFPTGGVADVKRLVDLMALYKFNTLHLHLTDDQGWRLMIESWPKLAEVGGSTAVDGDPGGYFSQAEYRDLVEYAASRYIDIVPEIDMPSHTNAALASYPELNCNDEAPALYTGLEVGFSSLCIDSEITYEFIDDVVREIAALTPGPYIHVGGDEAHSTSAADYQTFMARVQEIVQAHGKQMIGWADIAQIDLAPGTVAQYWQGDYGSRAAAQGVQVIMSPASLAYLDMKYDDATTLGLNWAGNIDVQKGYSWDPATVQPGVPEDSILGVETALWTETVRTVDDLDYLVFPRLLGYAEIGWSPAAGRSWNEYRQRLASHMPRLDALGVTYFRGWQD